MIGGFLKLWETIEAKGGAEEAFKRLQALYAEPHRFYHTLGHIERCLREFRDARKLAESPAAVEFAIWYHDAVYDPQAGDNEERSAKLAHDICLDAGLGPAFALEVDELIRATKHEKAPAGADGKLMMDIDLAILGRPAREFAKYETDIRREYSWVPAETYKERRKAVLKGFLGRPAIYATEHFSDKYEDRARDNLNRAIAKLI